MKKITFLVAAIALSLTACKKDFVCTCTSNTAYSNGNSSADGPTVTTIKDVHRATASDNCVDYQQTGATSFGTYTTTVDCNLSKK